AAWPRHGLQPGQGMTFFDLALRTESSLHPFGEPDDLIPTFTGVVRAEGEDGERQTVGRVRAWRINAGAAASAGEPLPDACDPHSHEPHVVHTLLFEPGGHAPREEVTDRFGLARKVEGDSGLTMTGAIVGTPSYMPPEIFNDVALVLGGEHDDREALGE